MKRNMPILNRFLIILIIMMCLSSYINILVYATSEFPPPPPGSGTTSTVEPSPTPDAPTRPVPDTETRVRTTTISGKIQEQSEARDHQEIGNNEHTPSTPNNSFQGVDGINLNLTLNGNSYTTTTDSQGNYVFNITPFSGTHIGYTIKYNLPNINESDIRNCSISDVENIQKKLKYNAQDYSESRTEFRNSIEISGRGIAQVFLLLDCSVSMKEDSVQFQDPETHETSTISKLDFEKRVAKKIIDNLLTSDKNIVVGLVVFTGESYRRVSLTKDKNTLYQALDSDINFEEIYYTNICGALNKAYESYANNNIDTSNRYVFILSDGLPTWDGVEENRLYSSDSDSKKNSTLRIIYQNTANMLKHFKDDKHIKIYSVITTAGLNVSEIQEIDRIYNNSTNHIIVENLNSLTNSTFLNEFEGFVQSAIQPYNTEYSIENTRPQIIQDNFKDFIYGNTYYFEALTMSVDNNIDLDKFKDYAIKLLRATQYTVEINGTADFYNQSLPRISSNILRDVSYNSANTELIVTTYYEDHDRYGNVIRGAQATQKRYVLESVTIPAGTSTLKQQPAFEINPSITITSLAPQASNGIFLDTQTTQINSEETLYTTIPENLLWGTKTNLEFTVGIKNHSYFNDNTNNFRLLVYLPSNFRYEENSMKISKQLGIPQNLNISEIQTLNTNTLESLKINKKLPSNSDKIEQALHNNQTVLSFNIKPETEPSFQFLSSGELYITFNAYKFLTDGNDTLIYNSDVEVLNYSNNAYRRSIYRATESNQLTLAVAGNQNGAEQDYDSSNDAVILIPTGKNKSLKKYYYIIAGLALLLLIISTTLIIIIKKKKSK